ncbi:hypothetical protein KDL44_16295, partial [bacterium]|nr:hypothetical protein [bacterium]
MLSFIDGRDQQLLIRSDVLSIPFRYPNRPTLDVRIGEHDFQFLLDSGTRLSILNLLASESKPTGLHFTGHDAFLADLDGKRELEYDDHHLRYAEAELLSSSDLRIRHLPLRTYVYEEQLPGTDFQGSLALQALRSCVVEVSNDELELRLHPLQNFQAPAGWYAVPLLQLHDKLLVQGRAGQGQPLLLMLDTGFSGELMLSGNCCSRLGNALEASGRQLDGFTGFHGSLNGEELLLDQFQLPVQDWPAMKGEGIDSGMLSVLALEGNLEQTALGELDGILGSGFLSRFNYAVDMSRSVLYLQE